MHAYHVIGLSCLVSTISTKLYELVVIVQTVVFSVKSLWATLTDRNQHIEKLLELKNELIGKYDAAIWVLALLPETDPRKARIYPMQEKRDMIVAYTRELRDAREELETANFLANGGMPDLTRSTVAWAEHHSNINEHILSQATSPKVFWKRSIELFKVNIELFYFNSFTEKWKTIAHVINVFVETQNNFKYFVTIANRFNCLVPFMKRFSPFCRVMSCASLTGSCLSRGITLYEKRDGDSARRLAYTVSKLVLKMLSISFIGWPVASLAVEVIALAEDLAKDVLVPNPKK
jgi:hypothetical protein